VYTTQHIKTYLKGLLQLLRFDCDSISIRLRRKWKWSKLRLDCDSYTALWPTSPS